MNRSDLRAAVLPLCFLLAHCGGDDAESAPDDAAVRLDGGGLGDAAANPGDAASGPARIQTQLASASEKSSSVPKFRGGAADATGLQSLKYQISMIMICESLGVSGSGFNNPSGCIELYRHDDPNFHYGLQDDWTSLADKARATNAGFIDLLSASSRQQLAGDTVLTQQHVRSYNYGIINWTLPIKLTATIALAGGGFLYTHDGPTRSETVGVDNFKNYYTEPSTSLTVPPAEEAVVLLGNGGNWFKFQSPLVITAADIEERRQFVLDLVFNADGIVKGFESQGVRGNLSERGATERAIITPYLDLAPVPHRASEQVLRETYQGPLSVDGNAFDLRVELYYVREDPTGTIYGVDVKTLVSAQTATVPPAIAKVSFTDTESDGTLSFSAFKHTPILSGFRRVTGASCSTSIKVSCAEHTDRAAVEGGAAIVVDHCPSPLIEATLALTARGPVATGVPTAVGGGSDAGTDAGQVITIGGMDAGSL